MKKKIYIAASWKHQHAVEMLTDVLRKNGYEVLSFVENNHGEQQGSVAKNKGKTVPFEEWVWSDRGEKSFKYDSESAMNCDLLIYVGPSGKDAAAECGMAFAKGVPMFALHAKGEDFGLMRRMFLMWFTDYRVLFSYVDDFFKSGTLRSVHDYEQEQRQKA